jgi:PEGA domain
MYRVIAILSGGLVLAACSSINLDFLKPGPTMETLRFESQPPGAEAKLSNGQTCRTPCALAVPARGPYTVTFTLNGYQPETREIELLPTEDNTPQLRPNPVLVELTPPPPPPKPVKIKKKSVRKKTVAKPAPKPAVRTQPAAASAPPPTPAAPVQQQDPSPWPTAPTR